MIVDNNIMEAVGEDDHLDTESEEEDSELSDGELQDAFAKGLLQPGLNFVADEPKKFANNVEGLKRCLADFRKSLPWVERLDLTNKPAEDIIAKAEGKLPSAGGGEVNAEDDFQREMFLKTSADVRVPESSGIQKTRSPFKLSHSYRQAQASVLQALPLLNKLNIATKRPEDYFAEMAKTDQHMQKIRKKLIAKQAILEKSEKAKKLREQRKYGKKVQVEVLQKRQKEKKAMMNAVKKYQKGMTDKLDFLEGDGKAATGSNAKAATGSNQGAKKGLNKKGSTKRKFKDQKFGFGGKKSGKKWNTKESYNDVSGFRAKVAHGKVAKGGSRGPKGKYGNKNKRPGKSVRNKAKNRK